VVRLHDFADGLDQAALGIVQGHDFIEPQALQGEGGCLKGKGEEQDEQYGEFGPRAVGLGFVQGVDGSVPGCTVHWGIVT